jgi:hypothetical protein
MVWVGMSRGRFVGGRNVKVPFFSPAIGQSHQILDFNSVFIKLNSYILQDGLWSVNFLIL